MGFRRELRRTLRSVRHTSDSLREETLPRLNETLDHVNRLTAPGSDLDMSLANVEELTSSLARAAEDIEEITGKLKDLVDKFL